MDKNFDDLTQVLRGQRKRTRFWFVCFAIAFAVDLILGGMLWSKSRENDALENRIPIEKPGWWIF